MTVYADADRSALLGRLRNHPRVSRSAGSQRIIPIVVRPPQVRTHGVDKSLVRPEDQTWVATTEIESIDTGGAMQGLNESLRRDSNAARRDHLDACGKRVDILPLGPHPRAASLELGSFVSDTLNSASQPLLCCVTAEQLGSLLVRKLIKLRSKYVQRSRRKSALKRVLHFELARSADEVSSVLTDIAIPANCFSPRLLPVLEQPVEQEPERRTDQEKAAGDHWHSPPRCRCSFRDDSEWSRCQSHGHNLMCLATTTRGDIYA